MAFETTGIDGNLYKRHGKGSKIGTPEQLFCDDATDLVVKGARFALLLVLSTA